MRVEPRTSKNCFLSGNCPGGQSRDRWNFRGEVQEVQVRGKEVAISDWRVARKGSDWWRVIGDQ
jgi:hypothetical protein